MLPVVWDDLTGRYLLEWMPLHRARRAANVEEGQGLCRWSALSLCACTGI